MILVATGSDAVTLYYQDGKRIWPYKWWLEQRDTQTVLCRKSHPDLPEDENVDFVDCDYAFESAFADKWEES